MSEPEGRRPLKVRNVALTQKFACWLSSLGVTPNQISLTSAVFAAMGALCLVLYSVEQSWLALLTALFIQ